MKLSDFEVKIPKEKIAKYPTENRDESKLMVVDRKTGEFEHKIFHEILDYFNEGDVLVLNDAKVFPARMYGNKEKTGAKIEVFLLRELDKKSRLWDALVDPARKIRIGNKLYFGENDELVAEVIDNTTSRGRTLRFLFDGPYEEFKKTLYSLGETPIPKYLGRPAEPIDEERFQTIYAKVEGSVTAPTAGLHFSKHLLKRLEIKGVHLAYITIPIGVGTFNPVEVEDLSKHKMDSERLIISEEVAELVNKAKDAGNKVFAVGASVARGLETPLSTTDKLKPFDGWTNKFIYPPYDFKIVDALITNFHPARSTSLMLASAFSSLSLMQKAYKEAAKNDYRFLVYGDAMLIL
jgi:S-adenosylmethionine:tRNA ribosyltransferase-isomerase